MVKVYVPADVVPGTLTVKLEAPIAGFVLKVGVAPAGSPLALKVTVDENPLEGVMVTP